MKTRNTHPVGVGLTLAAVVALSSCSGKGLLRDHHPESFYRIDNGLEKIQYEKNPRFLVYGDTQAGWRVNERFVRGKNWKTKKMFVFPFYQLYLLGQGLVGAVNFVRHVPDYGGKERRRVRDVVYAEVEDSRPDFVLNLGDIAMSDGRRRGHWETFLIENRQQVPLVDAVPYIPVIGNHDSANDEEFGAANFKDIFGLPRFFVMDFPDVAVFVIDSNFIIDQKDYIDPVRQEVLFEEWFVSREGSTQQSWLERELAARRDRRYKIVAMHHPPISFGRHFSDWERQDYGSDLLHKRRRLLSLFLDEGVDVVMSGHEHVYQHNVIRRRDAGTGELRRLHVVVSSGGGAPTRGLTEADELAERLHQYSDQGLDVRVVRRMAIHHYSTVEVRSGGLVVETFSVAGEPAATGILVERITVPTD